MFIYGCLDGGMTGGDYLRLVLILAVPGGVGGCTGLIAAVPEAFPAGIALAVEGTSVAVFGRGVVDIGVSAVTGRDCSIVRLDRRQTYCAPREQLPGPPPLCSRTLAGVTCWVDPETFPIRPRQVADTPEPTKEQVQRVEGRWPTSVNLFGN